MSGAEHVARLVATPGRCLLHEQEGTGTEVLAWDRETRTLAACQQARPTTLDPGTGKPDVDANPCYLHAPFRGRGYGWQVTSWTDVEGGRALLLADTVGSGAVLVDYDMTSCTQHAAYGADAIGAAKGGAGRMTQLACDPVTFGGTTVLWQRAGERVTPYAVPDVTCSVATMTTVDANATSIVVSVRTAGGNPLPGQSVNVAVDGARARTLVTGSDGTIRLPAPARHRRVRGDRGLSGERAVPAQQGRGRVRDPARAAPGNPPNQPPPPAGPQPPAALQPAQLPPAQPAPVPPAPVPAPGAQAPVGAPGQEEQQGVAGRDGRRRHSEEETEDLADELAMVLLVTGAAAGTAMCLRERATPSPAWTRPGTGATPRRTPPSRSARRRR